MVYYAVSAHLAARQIPAPPSHENDSAIQLPSRGQRYSVMPVNDPTIDIARIDRHAEPRRAVPN